MCTLTWLASPDGYELFFNRDEKHARGAASPPAVHESAGARWIAPTDPDGGGTWLGVNDHGLALGLLNGYRRADLASREFESRGVLVASLLDAHSLAEVRRRLSSAELGRFRSFSMVGFEPGEPALIADWTGERLELRALGDAEQPVCSSSLDPLGASASRKRLYASAFANRRPDRAALERFHASHEPERGSLSPCMHRADAETVSFSHVVVTRERTVFEYSPASPCRSAPRTRVELERANASRRATAG